MQGSSLNVEAPRMLVVKGEKKFDFVVKVTSAAQWEGIMNGFQYANGNAEKMRKVLAVALVDKIGLRNQALFHMIVSYFQEIQKSVFK